MAQEIQTTTGAVPALHISDTSKASLCSLTRRMGKPNVFRDPLMIRDELLRLGDKPALRSELQAIIAGPPRATVRDFALHLGKLALHFWRPEFTPEQAKAMYGDFVQDLDGVTAEELAAACAEWRTDPENSFYPTPGKLLKLVGDNLADRRRQRIGAQYLLERLETDPTEDELKPRDLKLAFRGGATVQISPINPGASGIAPDRHARSDALASRDPAAVERLRAFDKSETNETAMECKL